MLRTGRQILSRIKRCASHLDLARNLIPPRKNLTVVASKTDKNRQGRQEEVEDQATAPSGVEFPLSLMATWPPSLLPWRLFLHHKLDLSVNFTAAKWH